MVLENTEKHRAGIWNCLGFNFYFDWFLFFSDQNEDFFKNEGVFLFVTEG